MKEQNEELEDDLEIHKDVLEAAIGPWGRWQARLSFFMSLLKLPIAWFQLIILFLAPPTNSQCTLPSDQTGNSTVTCNSYSFDRSVFTETIITEWNLVGDRRHLASLAQMVFMLGVLVGNIVFGAAADRFGRKVPLMISIVLQSLAGLATAIVPWFSAFLVLRFLLATATGGIMVISFVICMENVGGRWRTTVPILYQIPFTLGLIMMSGAAYLLRHWRHLQLALSASTLAFFAFYWLVPESPRWLLAMGRESEAAAILKHAAKMNGLNAARVDRAIKQFSQERKPNEEQTQTRSSALFRTPRLRRNTILFILIWLAMGISFFGFSQFQGHLGGNIFANVAIAGLFGVPGPLFCVLAVRYLGRKKCIIFSLLMSGISCTLIAAVPLGSTKKDWARLTLAGISSFGMSVGFPALYLFSAELFPTVVRNAGMGISSMSARLGSMVAPFLISLSIYGAAIPPIVLGLLPILATILICPLPETRGCVLPETIEDAEMFSRRKAKQDIRNANYIRAPTSIPINENAY